MIAICENCQKKYTTVQSWYNRSKHHFCSKGCSAIFSKEDRSIQLTEAGKNTRFKKGRKKHPNHRVNSGSNHYAWKGDAVGYRGLHYWLRRVIGIPGPCIDCGSIKNCQWSNTDGKYRRSIVDYVSRCPSCHKIHDINLASTQDAADNLPQ